MFDQPDYVYSLDGEYFEEWDIIEDQIHSEYEAGEVVTVHKGKPVLVTHGNLLASMRKHFIEDLQEHAYDEDGDFAEGYLEDFGEDQEDALYEVIAEFLEEHATPPRWFRVDVKEEFKFTSKGIEEL